MLSLSALNGDSVWLGYGLLKLIAYNARQNCHDF
jgi:hypothetical protein